MGIRSIWEQTFGIKDMNSVYAKRNDLFLNTFQTSTSTNTFKLYAKGIGQFTSFSKELKTYIGNCLAFNLTIYKYTIHN